MVDLNRYIDHTLLRPDANQAQIERLCMEAVKYSFQSVCVNPCRVALSDRLLQNTAILVCTVIGFPLGAATTKSKCAEAAEAAQNGAREIDMVINIGAIKDGAWDDAEQDIMQVVNTVKGNAIVKVILETGMLTDEEKIRACHICLDAGAQYVKTSTGFHASGATVSDIALMCNAVGANMGVKASGGIKDYITALKMIEAGASRIGTSAGVVIMESMNKE